LRKGSGGRKADPTLLTTERLRLRRWRASDRAVFAAMSCDPVVMEHFPSLLSRVESDKMVERMEREFEERGYGLWAVERGDTEEFIGYTGLHQVAFEASFTPAVEIGWRLTQGSWGHGFASEAARRALAFAFEDLALPEVVSFTLPANTRSQAVMRRIGMVRDTAGDFDHPNLLDNDRLRWHILHRLSRAEWLSNNSL